ncbi:MAG: dockerin type I domain-containing protein [Planctomycetota bacterium]|nr:dockerin type I domain-containing protein [Planctomycetota bacterium]
MDPAVGNHSQTLSTTVSARPSQNPREPHDVDDADGVTPLDVLTLINYLNAHPGDGVLPGSHELPTPYYDVSGDGFCSALDVLMVVNHINAPPTGAGEGEAVPLETLPLQPVAAAMTNAKPESTLNSVSSTSGGEVLRTAQQDSIQGSSAASAWPAEDQTPLAAKADTAHQRLHREQHAKGDLFVRGIDPAGLESVLSDIGPDIDRAWQRR